MADLDIAECHARLLGAKPHSGEGATKHFGHSGKAGTLVAESRPTEGPEARSLRRVRGVAAFGIECDVGWELETFGAVAHDLVPGHGTGRHVEKERIAAFAWC